MPRGEARVEQQIREEHRKEDARREEENRRKREEYQYRCEVYRKKYSPPKFIDANLDEGPRPEIYPVIIAQHKGLVHVLRWATWAGAYAVTSTHREQYVHPDSIRFWMPMPEAIDPPEGYYTREGE